MLTRRWLYTVALCALSLMALAAVAAKVPPAKKKLLVVTHTAGFRHSSIPTAERTLAEIAERSGLFQVEFCRTAEDVKRMLTVDYLKGFDGVVFANTSGNLGIPDLKAFCDWIASGKAFIGAHAASDTYAPGSIGGDRSFVDMLGGQFRTHHAQCEVEAIVEDPRHPAVAHLAPRWKIFDEIYLFQENTRPKVRNLLSMDRHPNDGSKEANQPGDYQIAWCKMHGKGRVFYTSLGHREDVWENEKYRQHLLGGIRWALGLARGDARPILTPAWAAAK